MPVSALSIYSPLVAVMNVIWWCSVLASVFVLKKNHLVINQHGGTNRHTPHGFQIHDPTVRSARQMEFGSHAVNVCYACVFCGRKLLKFYRKKSRERKLSNVCWRGKEWIAYFHQGYTWHKHAMSGRKAVQLCIRWCKTQFFCTWFCNLKRYYTYCWMLSLL